MHALWIEWRQTTLQTTALLALAGALNEIEPDAHIDFDDIFGTPQPVAKQDPEERRRLIAALAAQ